MVIYYLSHTSPDDGRIEVGPYFTNRPDAEDAAKIMEEYPCNKKYGTRFSVGEERVYETLKDFLE